MTRSNEVRLLYIGCKLYLVHASGCMSAADHMLHPGGERGWGREGGHFSLRTYAASFL